MGMATNRAGAGGNAMSVAHLDRSAALLRTFQAAFKALDDFKSSAERQQIYDFIAAHLRSASPMSLSLPDPALAPVGVDAPFIKVEPETHIRRELGDGAAYDIGISDRFLRFVMVDVTGDDTMHHFEPSGAKELRDDIERVLLAMGVR